MWLRTNTVSVFVIGISRFEIKYKLYEMLGIAC